MEIRFVTLNGLNLYQQRAGGEVSRYGRVEELIRTLDADVIAVQELRTDYEPAAAGLLAHLAAETGMTATVSSAWYNEDDAQDATQAVGVGAHTFHVGLMWRPSAEIEPVPGSLRVWGAPDFFHALVKLTLRIDGRELAVASYQATPFGRHARADQAERVVSVMTRPPGSPPGIVGADWNCISADPRPDGSYYDRDWHADQPWHDDLVYQCHVDIDAGRRRHRVDREPGENLYGGGLRDAAAALDVPWQPTCGHWHDDPFGPRRVDGVRVTRGVVPALVAVETVRTDLALSASNHLPVVATIDTDRVR